MSPRGPRLHLQNLSDLVPAVRMYVSRSSSTSPSDPPPPPPPPGNPLGPAGPGGPGGPSGPGTPPDMKRCRIYCSVPYCTCKAVEFDGGIESPELLLQLGHGLGEPPLLLGRSRLDVKLFLLIGSVSQ